MASSRTKKPTAKAKAAAATKKKPAARSKTSRDKQTAAQRAAQRAAENAEEVVPEAVPDENNAPGSPDEAEGVRADREPSGTSESLPSASNNASSDVEELGSRPLPRKALGKAFLTSHIKVIGVRPSLTPPTERRSFEFSDDGYEALDIDMLLRDLLSETKERVEAELVDMEETTIELSRVLFEAGRQLQTRTFPIWSGTAKMTVRHPEGELPGDDIVEMLTSSEGPYYLLITHTYKVTLTAVQTTPHSTATPRRPGIEIFRAAPSARSVPSPADGLPAARRIESVPPARRSPLPRGPREGSISARMVTAMDGDRSPSFEAHKKLMQTWRCFEGPRCKANRRHRNKGDSLQQWCYVMKDGTHINIADVDLVEWAQAIVDGEAAIRGPPEELLFKWKKAVEADESDEEPGDDGVSLVPKRKKPKKSNKQRESGINVVVNPSINLHAPGFAYGHSTMPPPPPSAYSSGGFEGLPTLPAPAAPRPGSPVRHRQLLVLSSSPPRVPGDQKALGKDFMFEALRRHFHTSAERRQLMELQKVMRREGIDLRALHSKEDVWFNEKGLDGIKLVRRLVKPYLKEREDFSGLLESDDDEEEPLPPPPPAQNESDDPQEALESTYGDETL